MATLRGHSDYVTSVAFSPTDGTLLATGQSEWPGSGAIKLWSVPERALVATLRGQAPGGVGELVFTPDGAMLASCPSDTIDLWRSPSTSTSVLVPA